MRVIGIAGKARTGKDTLARHLVEKYGFEPYAFADPLKACLGEIPGVTHDHLYGERKDHLDDYYGFSWRRAMQAFGETMRTLNPDFWLLVADKALPEADRVVISDIRHENEAEFVRRRGLLIHIRRPQAPVVAHHISEAGVAREIEDVRIKNDGSIEALYAQADELMRMLVWRGWF